MLCQASSAPVHQPHDRVGAFEKRAMISVLFLVSMALILGWFASLPAIGLPAEPSDYLPEPAPSLPPSTSARDLGEPLFPDYYSSPFAGWRSGSDQPFSLIPVEPNGHYETLMQLPAPPQEIESGKQEKKE